MCHGKIQPAPNAHHHVFKIQLIEGVLKQFIIDQYEPVNININNFPTKSGVLHSSILFML